MATAAIEKRGASLIASVAEKIGGTERLTINLPSEVMARLRTLAKKESITVTEAIRRGISAEEFLRSQIDAGNEILIREKGSSQMTKVVVFR